MWIFYGWAGGAQGWAGEPPRVMGLAVLKIVARKHEIYTPEFKTKEVVRIVVLVKNQESSFGVWTGSHGIVASKGQGCEI